MFVRIPPNVGGCSRVPVPRIRTDRRIRVRPLNPSPTQDLRLFFPAFPPAPFVFQTPAVIPLRTTRMREMKLQDLKSKIPAGASGVRRGAGDRERQHPAQAGADVRDPQAARGQGDRHHRRRRRRGAVRRLRLPALAGGELPARPRRHLRLALADPPLRAAHRRHRRRPDPQPEGRRALLRAAQGQHHQFRGPREGAPQDQLRQPDAALSRRAAEDGARGSDQEGSLAARHRHRRADRQGPARADRVAAAHRQDRAAAEHRARDHRQSSRVLPDRAADRRAAGGSHRHAALGEGRGRVLDLRRAGDAPRRRSPRW